MSKPLILTRGAYALPGTALNFHTGSWRVQRPNHLHGTAPCHGACPSGEDAQAYLAKYEEGDAMGAWQLLVQANPLPAITGRVCHHPCEVTCNRGQYDEPIAIHKVERFLGDEAIKQGWDYPVTPPKASAPRFAVVGAGPAGLGCAYQLIRQGYNVTLFDELPVAGGMLHTALPPYRLPRNLLDAEIERLLAVGIDFKPHTRVGRDISLDELRQEFAAVFIGIGRQQGRDWSVDHVTPRDLHNGLNLLQDWIAHGKIDAPKSVAIVGGGNTAIDLARIMVRAGSQDVHVITHQAKPVEGESGDDLMSAIPREVTQAEEEGVVIHDQRGIRRLILRGERVVGLEMVRMKKLDKGNERPELVAFEGTETVLHVDQVIPAIGQDIDRSGFESLLERNSSFQVNTWGETGSQGIFSGGDAAGGGTVSGAIGDGRRAALAMIRFLHQEGQPETEERTALTGFDQLNLHYFEHAKREVEQVLGVTKRTGNTEVEKGFNADQVMNEARRCFSCGNCFACDNCWTLCPDSAVLKTQELCSDGSHYLFDYDYCKGCGLCATECPCGYITMNEGL